MLILTHLMGYKRWVVVFVTELIYIETISNTTFKQQKANYI